MTTIQVDVMAMVVVLTEDGDVELVLTAAATAELVRMGVTHVTLLSGGTTTGIVVEGWAFDPAAAEAAAAIVLGSHAGPMRALHPVAHAAVSTAKTRGDQR